MKSENIIVDDKCISYINEVGLMEMMKHITSFKEFLHAHYSALFVHFV